MPTATELPFVSQRSAGRAQESVSLLAPGEVLVLLSPVSDLVEGLYVIHSVHDGWAMLRGVHDDEQSETLWITERETRVPIRVLDLFMPVGINLCAPA